MVNSPLLPSSGSSSPPHGSGPSTSPPTTSLKSLDQLISNLPKGGFGHVAKRYFAVLALLALTTTLGFRLTKSSSEVQSYEQAWRPSTPITVTAVSATPSLVPGEREIDVSSRPLPLSATTRERLNAWANAPGGRGEIEGELELGGMYQINMESCANVWPSHSSDLIKNAQPVWLALNRSSIHHHRTRLINHLAELDELGVTKKYGSGRGVVFTAGNADTLERVIYTLRMMRKVYGSTLPAEIYHFPSERPPADSPLVKEANELGAVLVEAKGTEKDLKRRKNYHLKAIAIVQCPWREVLYLDSDNVPTRDPEYMFEAAPYKRTRAMFWPDYWKTAASNPIWAILGVRCRDEWEMEAGQILIDKKFHLDAMLLSQHMLEDFQFWFQFSDGDKDVFRFAFLALRKRWAVPGRYVGIGALPSGTASGSFCGLTMQQYDHLGDPLFIHYNLMKQVSSGIHRGFSWGRTKQFPLFLGAKDQPEPSKEPFLNALEAATEDGDSPDFVDDPKKVRGWGNVDCDMLADADDVGQARAPATEEVRRRAATERGARAFFHGGWTSALCVDGRYDDPRPDEKREEIKKLREAEDARIEAMWKAKGLKEGDEGWHKIENHAGESPLGIKWDEDNWEIAQWSNDPLLKDFENQMYDNGFVPSADGF